MPDLMLSVLDQSVALEGSDEAAAIRDTVALATDVEAFGYHRFWVSEHHGLPTIVGSAPEIVMAAVAARTARIRIGSAGVMLPHYSAYKVAEQFRVLEALAPGRIDLGVGRAPGGDMRTAMALNPHMRADADHFPEQIRDLHAWTRGPRHEGVAIHPLGPTAPQIWILGSSDYGARLAAHFGLPYAFAYFFSDGAGCAEAMQLYHANFRPSEEHPAPVATLCIWAMVAETDDEARHLALSRDRWRVDRATGRFGPLQSPDVLAARGFTPAETEHLAPMREQAFVGSPKTVGEKIRHLAAQYRLGEVVVNTWAFDPAVRRRSYALLAAEFGLPAVAGTSASAASAAS